MKLYSVGFLFNRNGALVTLILKNRPEWQAGKFNGVGGHVEDGETFFDCMVREFEEETGLKVFNWQQYAQIEGTDYHMQVFRSFSDDIKYVRTVTDEHVHVVPVSGLPLNILPNLRWLIPLALDTYIIGVTRLKGRSA